MIQIVPRPRPLELLLLLLAGGLTIAAAAPLPLRDRGALVPADLGRALLLLGFLLALHFSLVLRGRGEDQVLLPALLALCGIGVALSARLAPSLADRQWQWVALAGVALAVTVHLPSEGFRLLRRYRYTWAVLGMLLVALTLVAGRSAMAGGPRLWLGFGSLRFQPSEALKLLLVVFLAGYLEDKQELLSDTATRIGPVRLPPLPYLAPLAVMLGLSLALLAAQGDMGAALLLFTIALGMLYLASARLDYVLAALAVFSAGAYALHSHLAVLATRVAVWLDPWSQSHDAGFQLVQGLLALGAGGILGTGLGQGSPTDIPAVHTDFVYGAIAEEMGLAGATAILALYVVMVLRGFRIAIAAPGSFERLLAAGLSVALAVQVFIIIGGVVKLIPLTGITLPFLSLGGTSMLISTISIGLLVRISGRQP
jgi:cell division protein FtsW (lipid II flippase)